jgi:hypothetical protein
MKRLMSALVALSLLLAFAAPVAAVDETPAPEPTLITETPACPPVDVIDGVYVIPENAPEGCMYIQGGGDPSVEPMPIDLTTGDCAPKLALAVAAGETPIAPAPCLLPDGTLYELASRGTEPNERGDGDQTDYATMYKEWMAEFKATLEPCPEGADLNDISLVTCLLPDGTIAGPVPMFAGAPEQIEDVTSTTAEGSSEVALPVALAVIALVGLGGILLIRRRTA